jgi:hypothetical protein
VKHSQTLAEKRLDFIFFFFFNDERCRLLKQVPGEKNTGAAGSTLCNPTNSTATVSIV